MKRAALRVDHVCPTVWEMTARWLSLPLVLLLLVPGACPVACKKDEKPAAVYTVRGQIKTMPGPDGAIYIHHESIPRFVDYTGKLAGMHSMTMPFGIAPGVSLDGLAPGDKVEFVFAVHWDRQPPTLITSVQELPPDTGLDLSGH